MNDCTFNSGSVRLLTFSQFQTWRSLVEDVKEDNLQEKFRSNRFTEHEEVSLYKELSAYIEEVCFFDPTSLTNDWKSLTYFNEQTDPQYSYNFSSWPVPAYERIEFRSREMSGIEKPIWA